MRLLYLVILRAIFLNTTGIFGRTFLHLGSHLMFIHTQNKSLTALSLADYSWEVFTMLRANHPVSRVRSLAKLSPIKSFKKMGEHHLHNTL